ncbi:hypothetical protein WMY93_024228 [Mugilogobius chulae]|uniref:Glomulin, FKBP associated protein b n=1 Tax=Mugilogobius chulae TaxID=88201 RepID=A0AAW0N013_9GOBI
MTLCEALEPLPDILLFNSLRKHIPDSDESLQSRACVAYLLFVRHIATDSFPACSVRFSPKSIHSQGHGLDQIAGPLVRKKCRTRSGLRAAYNQYERESPDFRPNPGREREDDRLKHEEKKRDNAQSYTKLLHDMFQALYTNRLDSVEDGSLSVKLLELSIFGSVSQKLCCILRECPIKHLKESGLKIIQLFIDKLDTEARHKFFRCMLKTSNHSGIEGFIVKNIRKEVEFSLKVCVKQRDCGNESKWFLGSEFSPLLGLVLYLPQGPQTDLLNNMDKIMESLNLLRYLLIRSKELTIRVTEVWAELCRLRDEYLKVLRVCLSLSRAYYSSQLKSLQEDCKLKAQEARAAARDKELLQKIKLKQEKVSSLSPAAQHQVLQSAMVTFDLMESLVSALRRSQRKGSRFNNIVQIQYIFVSV